jgi:ppGpp synthetase/RelA/SpoT-type nucleotidyltranferase
MLGIGDKDKMDDLVKKLVNEFKDQRFLYEEFCLAVFQILNSLLRNAGYKYQIIYRVKELEKLEEKLGGKKADGRIYKALNEVEDLAGIRIIFYLESDRDRFIKNILDEISGELKLEHAKKETGYEATHIIAGLGPRRLLLSEYRKFDGLKCEIQLTSILYHAWAEIEHDIFYKEAAEINPKKLGRFRKRMAKIMKRHIKKASSEFEDIMIQIGRMGRGT